jgi:hypothetical protein
MPTINDLPFGVLAQITTYAGEDFDKVSRSFRETKSLRLLNQIRQYLPHLTVEDPNQLPSLFHRLKVLARAETRPPKDVALALNSFSMDEIERRLSPLLNSTHPERFLLCSDLVAWITTWGHPPQFLSPEEMSPALTSLGIQGQPRLGLSLGAFGYLLQMYLHDPNKKIPREKLLPLEQIVRGLPAGRIDESSLEEWFRTQAAALAQITELDFPDLPFPIDFSRFGALRSLTLDGCLLAPKLPSTIQHLAINISPSLPKGTNPEERWYETPHCPRFHLTTWQRVAIPPDHAPSLPLAQAAFLSVGTSHFKLLLLTLLPEFTLSLPVEPDPIAARLTFIWNLVKASYRQRRFSYRNWFPFRRFEAGPKLYLIPSRITGPTIVPSGLDANQPPRGYNSFKDNSTGATFIEHSPNDTRYLFAKNISRLALLTLSQLVISIPLATIACSIVALGSLITLFILPFAPQHREHFRPACLAFLLAPIVLSALLVIVTVNIFFQSLLIVLSVYGLIAPRQAQYFYSELEKVRLPIALQTQPLLQSIQSSHLDPLNSEMQKRLERQQAIMDNLGQAIIAITERAGPENVAVRMLTFYQRLLQHL